MKRILLTLLIALFAFTSVCDASRLREMETIDNGHICLDNTTTIPLGAGGVFTGPYQDTLNYNVIIIGIATDQDSATDGLVIRWSSDGITTTQTDEFSILANKGKVFTFSPANQYMSVEYTNGAVAQGSFDIQTIFKKGGFKASSHRIQDSIVGDDDAELVKAVLTGQDPGGIFKNVNTTVDGDLTISDNSSGLAIAEGEVTGKTFVHKFGNAPDFDTVDTEVTVWDGAEDGQPWELMNYVYSTTDDIDSVSSSNAADTSTVTIEGLDVNWALVTQQITLTGQTRAALTTPLLRVFRAYNDNGTEYIGHIIVYVNGVVAGGVPTVQADIRAVIHPEDQQTLMSVYTIPAGQIGYMRDWYISTSGGSKSSNYVFKVKAREDGGVFRTKHTTALEALSPIPYEHTYKEPEIFTEKTDIEMRVESIASPSAVENAVSAGFDIVLVSN